VDIRGKRWWPDLPEDLPVDVMPASNGEFFPAPPSKEQIDIMAVQNAEVERYRRRVGMSRRDFVRSAMAYSIGFWAINQISDTSGGHYSSAYAHNTDTTDACDLEWADETDPMTSLLNLPGEFIFDVQSHHVESDGMWRVTNPMFEAFFSAVWSQAGPLGNRATVRGDGSVRGFGAGEIDPIENLSRYHYIKELFLDSATTMTVLSAVPAAPDINQPLPIDRASETVRVVNELAGNQRTVLHAFVMPNRGSAGTVASSFGREPVYMQREFEIMEERAIKYNSLIRGWKTYPAWGDVAYASGWFFDDPLVGGRFLDHVAYVSEKYNLPANVATHKGFALPGFDQRAASPRDIGPSARKHPNVNFIVYHSGYDGGPMGPYPGDSKVNSADRSVDAFVKSLRENGWDASKFPDRNVPNVYAEIGSTWRSVMGNPTSAAHLLGKLITHVGPKRICWGTDSLWFGSPHAEIIGLRKHQASDALKAEYNLPYWIDGDVDDPQQPTRSVPGREGDMTIRSARYSIRNAIFGFNAAEVYSRPNTTDLLDKALEYVSHDSQINNRSQFRCDEVQRIRDGYILNQLTPKENVPMASNQVVGERTWQGVWKARQEGPWAP